MPHLRMINVPLDLDRLRHSCSRCSLRELCLPAGIDKNELRQLDEIVKRRRPVQKGERLFRLGDSLESVYVARDGAFKTVCISEDGEEQVMGFHLPGELIGLDALGSGEHRCEAIALTTANVCEVPYDELTVVAAHLPSLQHQLMRVIGNSMDRDHDHMEMLVRKQANERIAYLLHNIGERLAYIGKSSVDFKLPMSREEIARYLGLAVETVSRSFTRLQEDGVIAVAGRRVQVLDLDELHGLAHGSESTQPDAQRASEEASRHVEAGGSGA